MKIIDRYVLWLFIKNYLISMMVLIGMYVVLDMVFNFNKLVDLKGNDAAAAGGALHAAYLIFDYYFYQCFVFFATLSGIIPVVAAAFTLLRLSRFHELTAMLAAGVPLLRVAMPIILAGLVLNGLVLVDQELVIPRMIPKLVREHDEVGRDAPKTFPIQAMQDGDHGLLYAGRFTPADASQPASMTVVDIIQRKPLAAAATDQSPGSAPLINFEPVAKISAQSAVWNAQRRWWDLTGGQRITGLLATQTPSSPVAVDHYSGDITPEDVKLFQSRGYAELLSTERINRLLEHPLSYGQLDLLRVKYWRLTQPIMNIVILLLAIPCVLTREPGKIKSAASKCLIFTAAAMAATFIAHQLAGFPPDPHWMTSWMAAMAWLPIFLFGPISVVLLDRIKT